MHDLTDLAETLKQRSRVGKLDLPERRKKYTSSREEDVDAHMYPFGKAIKSRTRMVGECEMCKEEGYVLEEGMGKTDECDMEEFGTLQTVARKRFYVLNGISVMSPQLLEVSLSGVIGTVLHLERDA